MYHFTVSVCFCATLMLQLAPVFGQSNCTETPCQNQGTCNVNTGTCSCPDDFFGDLCDSNPCVPDPCINGMCSATPAGSYFCICSVGYVGATCDMLSPCMNSPCLNNGTCMIAAGSTNATCTCQTGYSGTFCEATIGTTIDPSMSTSTPAVSETPGLPDSPCFTSCQNGGTCMANVDQSHSCFCPYGWGGVSCEIEMDVVVPRFEGTGYLSYTPLSNGDTTFQLRFRTSCANGLLLYNAQSDFGFGDFVQLFVNLQGFLEYRIDLGQGTGSIVLEHRVDDGRWHEVAISRNAQSSTLVLDSNASLSATGCSPGTFVSLNVEQPLYIGGVPAGIQIPPSTSAVPGLVGCIFGFEETSRSPEASLPTGGVNVGECESSVCQFSLCANGASCSRDSSDGKGYTCNCTWGFAGEFCTEPMCAGDPCLYGGTCVPADDGTYSCLCAYGYTGPACASAVNVTTPSYGGSSHIAYSVRSASALAIETVVSFRVRTESANSTGVLVFGGQRSDGRGDYIIVGVVNDIVYCRVELGSGSVSVSAPNSLQPGIWFSISVVRNRKSVSLQIDSNSPVSGETPGVSTGLQISSTIFVGGFPDMQTRPNSIAMGSWTGFVGCITDFTVTNAGGRSSIDGIDSGRNVGECQVDACFYYTCLNAGACELNAITGTPMCVCQGDYLPPDCATLRDPCDIDSPCVGGSTCTRGVDGRAQCLCPYGFDGETCSEAVNIGVPRFNKTLYAHMQLPPLPSSVGTTTTVVVSLFPEATDGLILYAAMYMTPASQDFFSISMKGGHVEFRYNLGSGVLILRSAQPLPLLQWHQVMAHRAGAAGYLTINGVDRVNGTAPGSTQALNLNTPLFVGGAPDYRMITPLAGITQGFGGCIDNVVVDNIRQTVAMATRAQDVLNCGEDPCVTLNCLNGGVCTDSTTVAGTYVCVCPGNFTGDRCQLDTPDPCVGVACENEGRCVVDGSTGRCACPVPYGGPLCREVVTFAAGRFSGLSYLELYRFAFTSPDLNRDEFLLDFRSPSSSGLLLWMGGETQDGDDFMALGVSRGRLELRFDLGSGAVLLRSSSIVSDGNWHTVSVLREGGTATLTLDGRSSNVTSAFVSLDSSSNIWLGGHVDPDSTGFPANLAGCLRGVAINGLVVDLDSPTHLVSSLDVTSCD